MHDLHLSQKIIKLIEKYAAENNLRKITRARIGLGKIIEHGEMISPDNLSVTLRLLAEGTVAAGAKFLISSREDDSFSLDEIEGQ